MRFYVIYGQKTKKINVWGEGLSCPGEHLTPTYPTFGLNQCEAEQLMGLKVTLPMQYQK